MQNINFNEMPDFKIENPGFVNVSRNRDFTFEFEKGKKKHSFIYVEGGKLEYFFKKEKRTIEVNKGNMLFAPKEMPYKTIYLMDNTVIKIFTFDMDSCFQTFKEPFTVSLSQIPGVFTQCTRERVKSTFFMLSKIYELLHILQSSNISTSKASKKILPALEEIQKNFFENRKISYYAELCHMSESNFRKLFKEQTGKTPIEYRNILRLEEAKRMIDSGEYTTSEAAYTAGFNNMSFYYELLKNSK